MCLRFLGRYLGVELWGHMVALCLTFCDIPKLFSKSKCVLVHILTSNMKHFLLLHLLGDADIPYLSNINHLILY